MPATTRQAPASGLTFFDVLRFAAGYWRRQLRRLAVISFLLVVAACLETYIPRALSDFLTALKQDERERIFAALTLFVGAYGFKALLFQTAYILYNVFETKVFKHLLDDAFAHVHGLSEQFFASTFMGSIISKINRARMKIETFEDQVILRIMPTFVVLAGSTFFLALQFPALALALAAYFALMLSVSAFFVFRVVGPRQSAYADAQDAFGAQLADSITGIATTKSYAQEDAEISRFLGMTKRLRRVNVRAYIASNLAFLTQQAMSTGMLALLMGGGTWYYLHGRASLENMAYLAFAYTIVQSYMRELGENIKNLLTASYDLHAVIALLREPPEVPEDRPLPPLRVARGEIAFENVAFAYPGKTTPVFRDFSLTIRAGERVALVGPSGSGKTSFVRLLLCLYQPQGGRILIDGQDIAQTSRASLRGAIALVPQDPILFHRSLRENIAYGKPGATLDEVREAARLAHVDAFINTLPDGYETLVGERGIKLSGGERQRVAIARALLADRPILVLDEATSSLDSASEHVVQAALRTLTHGRTSVMIAHRLSTILDADRIVVFKNGAIAEQGTHEELLARKDGVYAELFRLQSGGFLSG